MSKAIKTVRAGLPTGTHTVDGTFRVTGTVTVGEDYVQSFPGALCPWKIACVLADKVNEATLEAALREAAALPDDRSATMKAFVTERTVGLVADTQRTCAGKVTHKCVVAEVTSATQAKEILAQVEQQSA